MHHATSLAAVLFAALTAVPVSAQAPESTGTRRVNVTLSFSGQEVLLYGQAPAGTTRVLAILEGPPAGSVRLMEKGRVGVFWLGVRQYRLSGVPAAYLVNVSCPVCNGMTTCDHGGAVKEWSALLGFPVGREALAASAVLECLSGTLAAGEEERTLEGFWDLQERIGLYAVHRNAIRLAKGGTYYHRFTVPTRAPEGKYRVATFFASRDALLGSATEEIFVRTTGLVSWLSRLAERRAAAYGAFSVAIAVVAGLIAGTLFKRGGGH